MGTTMTMIIRTGIPTIIATSIPTRIPMTIRMAIPMKGTRRPGTPRRVPYHLRKK